jgi:hypothetical protein
MIAILVLLCTVILAIVFSVLLTPITLWLLFRLMNKLSDKITNSKHYKVNGSQNNIRKINYTNYGFSFGPLQIGKNEPIYKGYITYLKHRYNDNLNNNCLNMVGKPIQQSCRHPVFKPSHTDKSNIEDKEVQPKENFTGIIEQMFYTCQETFVAVTAD